MVKKQSNISFCNALTILFSTKAFVLDFLMYEGAIINMTGTLNLGMDIVYIIACYTQYYGLKDYHDLMKKYESDTLPGM